MATDRDALKAQFNVLRILAPELCRLIDAALEAVHSSEPPVHGQHYCPCGEKTWDDDWEDASPKYRDALITDAANHECAWTRMVKAWAISTT